MVQELDVNMSVTLLCPETPFKKVHWVKSSKLPHLLLNEEGRVVAVDDIE